MTATFLNRIFTYYHFIIFLLHDIKFDLEFHRRALLLKLKASTTARKLFLSKAKASELFYTKQMPLTILIQSKGDYTFFYPKQTLLNHFHPKQRLLNFFDKKGFGVLCLFSGCCEGKSSKKGGYFTVRLTARGGGGGPDCKQM